MASIAFSWDPRKARDNLRKHGVAFEQALTVFFDENARLIHDPDPCDEEDRFVLLGFSSRLRLLVVCHAYRREKNEIRIISLRRAGRREQEHYGSHP